MGADEYQSLRQHGYWNHMMVIAEQMAEEILLNDIDTKMIRKH